MGKQLIEFEIIFLKEKFVVKLLKKIIFNFLPLVVCNQEKNIF